MGEEFTHLTDSGVHMVEVGGKPDQKRRAIASGSIFLDKHTIELIQNERKLNLILDNAQIHKAEVTRIVADILNINFFLL